MEKTPSKVAINEANNNDSQSVSQKSQIIGQLEVRKPSTTPQKTSLSRLLSCETVSANPAQATCVGELEILAQFYSRCIAGWSSIYLGHGFKLTEGHAGLLLTSATSQYAMAEL